MNTTPTHFLTDTDLNGDEQAEVLELAAAYKQGSGSAPARPLDGKSVALVFEKPSTRTRISFDVAVHQLGGHPVSVDATTTQLGRGETVADTARVLSRYVDAVVMRTYEDQRLAELAHHASVPVVNALTDGRHPCQVLADLQTIAEHRPLAGTHLTYLGDASNNVAASLLIAGVTAGLHIRLAAPEALSPGDELVQQANDIAAHTGGSVQLHTDPRAAVRDADVLYTDAWNSMGQQHDDKLLTSLRDYQINRALIAEAPDAVVLHCLPAHRGEEITDDIIDGPFSRVFDQAENRLHAHKALLTWLIGEH
ncbi:ornithine carbamoyltransferase [Haloglycomyces albus]|uniref:ornithine carbamoyltransferase n=1 Tax=Haloglycomyces albus TaxID=526067 RepID=UPI00046CE1E1|nr:ornithine carbamoyltransferase [Haloglycomyces albus]